MPRRNRIDPWGDLHTAAGRGLFTGNRGCLVDGNEHVVRHHRGSLWITCLTEYKDWKFPLARPGRWTPVFFLDDAVALAAGHRPCGLCRRDAYCSYRDAVTASVGAAAPLSATALNQRLARERHRRGSGIDRARDRRVWRAAIDDLPTGVVILGGDRRPRLLLDDRSVEFTFDGWRQPASRPSGGAVEVLTPPTSVAALTNGFVPVLHPSAAVA